MRNIFFMSLKNENGRIKQNKHLQLVTLIVGLHNRGEKAVREENNILLND